MERCKELNRYRCRACSLDFCAACSVAPFHDGKTCLQLRAARASPPCRFCGAAQPPECAQPECVQRAARLCGAALPCGHVCAGVRGETVHAPCLEPACAAHPPHAPALADYCAICWTEALEAAPVAALPCGHAFHVHCLEGQLRARWSSPHIAFGCLHCPLCQARLRHPALAPLLAPLDALYESVAAKALRRLEFLGQQGRPELTDASSPLCGKPLEYALRRFCYYECAKCHAPYFGGERDCNAQQRAEPFDASELLCARCSGAAPAPTCAHGPDFVAWKCKFCCNTAAWFCWGNTHFCDQCHKDPNRISKLPRDKLPRCSCSVKHPPNGEEFCLGCSLCLVQPGDF